MKNNSSVLFVECTEMNWKHTDANGLCFLILLINMRWYLGFMGKLQNDECIIYIFTGKVENGTPSIFNKTLYNVW